VVVVVLVVLDVGGAVVEVVAAIVVGVVEGVTTSVLGGAFVWVGPVWAASSGARQDANNRIAIRKASGRTSRD
jgi:hypothetical protein